MGRIFTVCSGSGGVGKSTIAISLAAGMAKAGYQTILLDASGASRSCDLMLSMESVVVLDMMDILRDQVSLSTALYPVACRENLRFACASLYDDVLVSDLSGIMLALQTLCDVLVVDMPTGQIGLGRGVMKQDDEMLIITRPDDASIRACERLIQKGRNDMAGMSLVINRMCRDRVKRKTQYNQETVQNVLDCIAMECIPEDSSIADAEKKGKIALECDGSARAALHSMIKTLMKRMK